MNTIINLTPQQLRHAANLKEKIATHQKELDRLFGVPAKAQSGAAAKGKRTMSAAARAKIAAAARARWAKIKRRKTSVKPVKKPGGKMSAAAKAKLSVKMKAVWAARKASQRK
jgi:hypothetical protein